MSEDVERPVSFEDHPLRRRSYRLPTQAIGAFRKLIDDSLFLYISGALVHGRPRMGKSYAIEFMRRDLAKRYPKMSVYKLRCARSQMPSENSFFSALLHSVKHPSQSGASKAALRGRLLHKIRQVAEHQGDDRILLFADEAQHLREIEYEWLRDLHDELELNGLRLFTFLVGQPQLLAQKSALQAQDKEHIVARFMVEELAFRGISSAKACESVMAAYDHGEYPEKSGWSYTRFWVPRAYSAGLRMRESAERLWSAFEDAHIRAGLEGPVEIPMKYFTAAIEAALMLSVTRDGETLQFDSAFWSDMVEQSRFVMAQKASRAPLAAMAR